MARAVRIEYEGAVYHVMARGHERGSIFRDDRDRELFLDVLGELVVERRWLVHGYCLMTNHYHMLLETPLPNLSVGMQILNGRYSQGFNLRHGRSGHLFESRFKAVAVEKESYLLELCRYVVLNPVRAGMVGEARDWPWSNYRATSGETPAPSFLSAEWTLARFGNISGVAQAGYRQFVADGVGGTSPLEESTAQIYLGSPAFLSRIRALLQTRDIPASIPREQRLESFTPMDDVISAVCQEWGVSDKALLATRGRGASEAKAAAVYLARRLTGLSSSRVASTFGISGSRVSQLAALITGSHDDELRRRVVTLERRLRSEFTANAAVGYVDRRLLRKSLSSDAAAKQPDGSS
jgi:putative transposase